MNKYVHIIDDNGRRITSLADNVETKEKLIKKAKEEFPDGAQYIYGDDDMLTQFLAGKIYVGGQFVDVQIEPYIPTAKEIRKSYSDKLGSVMDAKAQEYGYDGILTAVTYADSTIDKFAQEGKAFKEWRDSVYATGYAYLAEVESGTKTIPATDADFIKLIPVFPLDKE